MKRQIELNASFSYRWVWDMAAFLAASSWRNNFQCHKAWNFISTHTHADISCQAARHNNIEDLEYKDVAFFAFCFVWHKSDLFL